MVLLVLFLWMLCLMVSFRLSFLSFRSSVVLNVWAIADLWMCESIICFVYFLCSFPFLCNAYKFSTWLVSTKQSSNFLYYCTWFNTILFALLWQVGWCDFLYSVVRFIKMSLISLVPLLCYKVILLVVHLFWCEVLYWTLLCMLVYRWVTG